MDQLGTELTALKTRFSDSHPDVIKAMAEIEALRHKLAGAAGSSSQSSKESDNPAYITLASQLASTQVEITSLLNQMKDLQRTKIVYEQRIAKTPKVEQEYTALLAEQANLKSKHTDLNAKYMEATVAHGLEKEQKGERFTLIDPPRLPERPFKPNRVAIIVAGMVLGVGAGVGWAALREFADQAVHIPAKLASQTGLLVLGTIPLIISPSDYYRMRMRKQVVVAAFCIGFIMVVGVIHIFIMDLSVLWARLSRKIMM